MEFFREKPTGRNGVEISIPDDPRPAIGSIVLGTQGISTHIGYVYVRADSRGGVTENC